MRTREELKRFWVGTLLPDLVKLEQERKRVLKKAIKELIIGILTVIVALLFLARLVFGISTTIFLGILFLPMLFLCPFFWVPKYQIDFKDTVIAPLIAFIDGNLQYNQFSCVPQYLYEESKIFRSYVDQYYGDDFVQGRIGETDIQFSEIHVRHFIKTRSLSYDFPIDFFNGLFFVADFNKHFKCRTVILPHKAEIMLGGIGRFLQSRNMSWDESIKMDDPEFEKEFAVYGTDQIEARYILTSSLMKRISDFRKKTGKKIRLSFVYSKVFIAIPYTKKLFETNIFRTLLRFVPIEEYFNDLSVALGIVEDLNLNTRIWIKE